jgi:anti-sigma factor RsiW
MPFGQFAPVPDCPDAARLEAFGWGRLAADESDALELHLKGCPRCQAALAALSRPDLTGSVSSVNAYL